MNVIECLEAMGVTFYKGEMIAVPEGAPFPSNHISLGEYYLKFRDWYIKKYY